MADNYPVGTRANGPNGPIVKTAEGWVPVGAGPAQPQRTMVKPKSETLRRKEGAEADKSVIDVQQGAATLPYAAPKMVADIGSTQTSTALTQQKLEEALLERERGNVSAEQRAKALDAFNAAPALDKLALDIEEAYKSGVGKTGGVSGILDYLPTGENRQFGLIGGRARGTFKQALGFTGGEGNTAGELTINYGPYIPDQYDTNEEVERKLSNIRELAKEARKKSISYLGGIPDAAGRVAPLPRDLTPDQVERIYSGASLPTAAGVRDEERLAVGAGVTSRGGFIPVPSLQGIDQQVIDMVGQGRSSDEIMAFLNQAYTGTEPEHGGRLRASPELGGFVSSLVERHRRDPSKPVRSLGSKWEMLGGYEQGEQEPQTFLGIDPDSALGAGAISAGNAVTFGNLGNLTGRDDVLSAARNERRISSFTGDVIGSGITMGGLTGLGGRAGIGALTRGGGIGSDVAYGAGRGLSEGDGDWRYGLLGAGAAAGGNVLGQAALAPAVRGLGDTALGGRAADAFANAGTAARNAYRGIRGEAPVPYQGANIPRPLSTGENVVARNLPEDIDSIVASLTQARESGLPMALADTSPQLRNLGGAAYRRADLDTQAQIEQALMSRSRGQAGRAQEQIASAFGPLDDPLIASQALMKQARENAGPLYDAFRAQPSRTSPELEAMLQTPAGRQALGNARNIAANEQIDPNSLGFDLDAQGNTILTSNPSPQTLDLIKRGFDDVLEGYRDTTTGRLVLDDMGRTTEGLRSRYVAEADRLFPDTYPQARAAYGGPAAENAALTAGQTTVGQHPRNVGQRMEGLTDPQLEQFRLGQRTAMGDRVQGVRTSSNPYESIWGDPLDAQRAGLVFGDDAARQFQGAYDVENAMGQTRNAFIGGSPTQSRQALDQQLGGQLQEGMTNAVIDTAATGMPLRAGLGLAQRLLGDRAQLGFAGAREAASSDIARLLADQGAPVDEIAMLLADAAARRGYVNNLRSSLGGVGAAAAMGGTQLGY